MTLQNLKSRFGTGAGGPTLEDGLAWLAEKGRSGRGAGPQQSIDRDASSS
jgi:hypothetical protein